MTDHAKYARLMKVDPDADLAEIKRSYGKWRQQFEQQIRSGNPQAASKGQRNLRLLDQAYQALAAVAAEREKPSLAEASSAAAGSQSVSVQLAACRVGFHLNECEDFQVMVGRHIDHFKVSWPLGRIILFSDKLRLKAMVFTAEISYGNLERVSRPFFLPMTFRFQHREPGVYPTILVYGPGLGRALRRLNARHGLDLPLQF